MNKLLVSVGLVGGILLTGALYSVLNNAAAHEKIVVDRNGVTFKLSNIVAEDTNTGLMTSINGGELSKPSIYKMTDTPKQVERLIALAGAKTTDMMQADGTFCFVTFVSYKDKDAGVVDVPLGAECKTFLAGSMMGRVLSFAEDYTKEVTNTYKTKFNVLK